MLRCLMKSKLHRVTITETNLNYVGSLTIDAELMEAADIVPNEKVQVVNVNNGNRFETYVIPGERGSRIIGVNGAAARLAQPGDRAIIISYALFDERELRDFLPTVVFVDEDNEIISVERREIHGTTVLP